MWPVTAAPSERITAGGGRLPALDGVRAVAAIAIVVTHVAFQTGSVQDGPLGALQARLDCGVAIFFALSGFLLVRPWLDGDPLPRGAYFARRAARVFPAYWLAMTAAVLVDRPDAWTAVTHVWLGQVYAGRLLDDFTQTWSLSAEVAFYLVLPVGAPLLARYTPRRQLAILGGLAVAGLALTWLVRADVGIPDRAGFWMPVHLSWFAGGIALAVLIRPGAATAGLDTPVRWLRQCAAAPGTVWAVAVVVLAFASTPLAGPLTLIAPTSGTAVMKELLYTVVAVLVLAPFVTTPAGPAYGLRATLASPVGRWLGHLSYGIFLWHLLVLHAVFVVLDRPRFAGGELTVLVWTLLGSIVIAALSWHLVEAPILRRVHRATRTVAPHEPAPAAR